MYKQNRKSKRRILYFLHTG